MSNFFTNCPDLLRPYRFLLLGLLLWLPTSLRAADVEHLNVLLNLADDK